MNKLLSFYKISAKQRNQKGFTLLETFIAITVLMLALVGPLTVTQRSIRAGAIAKEQVIASFLAQDALEYIRAVREEYRPNWDGFLNFFSNCVGSPCSFGTVASEQADRPVPCPAGSVYCPVIKVNPESGQYGYTNTYQDTPFVRTVEILRSEIGRGIRQEALVTVSVFHRRLSPTTPITEVKYTLSNW